MEIGRFYMKEKQTENGEKILWQVTIYDNYQIDVHPYKGKYELFKYNFKLLKQAFFNSIKVNKDTAEDTLEKTASEIINTHKKYIEDNGLENPVFITRKEDMDRPTYIG